jgi:threonine dehydrogenase-like Zn-dependent dehydrogenase
MSSTTTMKAVNYQGAFKVKVEDVPMPTIEHPDDVIVKVTTSGKAPLVRYPSFF